MSLYSRYIEYFAERAGACSLREAAGCLRQCGFDENGHLSQNVDLQQTGHDPSAALLHFLTHGLDEERRLPALPLPDGLETIERLDIFRIGNTRSASSAPLSSPSRRCRNPPTGCGTRSATG